MSLKAQQKLIPDSMFERPARDPDIWEAVEIEPEKPTILTALQGELSEAWALVEAISQHPRSTRGFADHCAELVGNLESWIRMVELAGEKLDPEHLRGQLLHQAELFKAWLTAHERAGQA